MAEDIWQNLPYETKEKSVFEGGWPSDLMSFPEQDEAQWALVRSLRDDINKLLELARADKLVGASLDAAAYIYTSDEEVAATLAKLDGDENMLSKPIKTNGVDELRTTLMLSQVRLVDSADEITSICDEKYVSLKGTTSGCVIGVKQAEGNKCGRCWFYDKQVGNLDQAFKGVCEKCNDAIFEWEKRTGETFKVEEALAPEPVSRP